MKKDSTVLLFMKQIRTIFAFFVDSRLPVCDLSIHRLAGVTPPSGHPAGVTPPSGHPSWGGIMQSLKLPTYSSADTVLSKLLENKEKGEHCCIYRRRDPGYPPLDFCHFCHLVV